MHVDTTHLRRFWLNRKQVLPPLVDLTPDPEVLVNVSLPGPLRLALADRLVAAVAAPLLLDLGKVIM